MYRCKISGCGRVSPPRKPLLRHVVYRPDGTIERELAVCGECDGKLRSGVSLERLVRSLNGQTSSEALAAARVYPAPLEISKDGNVESGQHRLLGRSIIRK